METGQFYSSLGVVWMFGFVVVMLIAWHLRGKRQLEKLRIVHEDRIVHEERMKAMEKGIPLPEFPELKEDDSRALIGKALASNIPGQALEPALATGRRSAANHRWRRHHGCHDAVRLGAP